MSSITSGPVITRFELNLAPGSGAHLQVVTNSARSLSTVAVRVVEVIPGNPM
ncbi:DNA translocase FtsK [Escherichia coli]